MSTQHWLFNIRSRRLNSHYICTIPPAHSSHIKSHKVVDTFSLCRRPLMLLLSRFCYLNIVTVWSRWAISERQQKSSFPRTRNIILLEEKRVKKILALSSNINGEKCHHKTWRLMIDRYFQTLIRMGTYFLNLETLSDGFLADRWGLEGLFDLDFGHVYVLLCCCSLLWSLQVGGNNRRWDGAEVIHTQQLWTGTFWWSFFM